MKNILALVITIICFSLLSCSNKKAKQELWEAEKEVNEQTGIEINETGLEAGIEINETGLEEDSIYEDSADIANPDIVDNESEIIKE